MRLCSGLLGVCFRVPAHAFEVHHCDVVIFGVAADAVKAGAVIQFTAFVFQLVQRVAVAEVGGVDDAHLLLRPTVISIWRTLVSRSLSLSLESFLSSWISAATVPTD